VLTGSLSGSLNLIVQSGATFDVSSVLNGFTLGATQTLKGTGTIIGAISASGTVAPGPGLGTLSTGALSFTNGSVLALDLNTSSVAGGIGQSDLLTLNGALSLSVGGTVPSLSLTDLGSNVALATGTQFTLLTYTGGWNGGLFRVGANTIADDATFALGANRYQLDYNAGGNSVALTVVPIPEPAAGATLLAGLGTLLGWRRRRPARSQKR
jgi:MYXO-CTERM domain-containing protein